MGGCITSSSNTFSVSSVLSPYKQLVSVPENTATPGRNSARVLDRLPNVSRRPSNAPPSSPVSSQERSLNNVLSYHAAASSCCSYPLIYLEKQLVEAQSPAYEGESVDLGSETTKPVFSLEDEAYSNGGCAHSHNLHCHCSFHDDDSTMVGLSTRAQSISSETGTVLENYNLHNTTHEASLSYNFPELYPSDPNTLRCTMPSPIPSTNYVSRSPWKPLLQDQQTYALPILPSVATRSRQISLPVMSSINPTLNPDMSTSASSRAQSWHAPIYPPSREPPRPAAETEKSVFEDYDEEENLEEKKLSGRFRHLIRRLHCG